MPSTNVNKVLHRQVNPILAEEWQIEATVNTLNVIIMLRRFRHELLRC